MDEPKVISNRLTKTAQDTIDGARAIAKDAIAQAASPETYTASNVVDTYFRAVELGMTSGMQATRDVLGLVPPGSEGQKITEAAEGRRLVADAMEAIARRMVRQAREVVKETADGIDQNPVTQSMTDPTKLIPNPNGPSVWVKSFAKLSDIALLGAIEMAETALIGPAPFERNAIRSDDYAITGNGLRRVSLTSAGIARPGTNTPVPDAQVAIVIPGELINAGNPDAGRFPDTPMPAGVLPANKHKVIVKVDPVGLISGVYVGEMMVHQQATAKDADGNDTLVDTALLETFTVEIPV